VLGNRVINLVGYSGHGLVLADAAVECGLNLKYYTDKKENPINPYSLIFLGNEFDEKFTGWGSGIGFILGIGDNRIRQMCGSFISKKGEDCIRIFHPRSIISKKALIGRGVFVSAGAIINPFATVGDFCIVNTGAVIEHDCILSTAVHVAPGAVLCGNVKVGERSFIGSNAVVRQGISIGSDVIVGAGAVVIDHVSDGTLIFGNPAKIRHI
jgi:sugar O-acyltransferase (sialic acid O-acetyltransferase NeuD family)